MIAIAGGKGGCGKTTTAVGLARALARRGARVLVVDADRDMPNLHRVAAPADRDRPRASSEPVGGSGSTHETSVRAGGLGSVARPSRRVAGVSLVTASVDDPLTVVLDRAVSWDGPVLLDCPAGASPDATMPLRYAGETVVVTTADPQSVADGLKTVAMARALEAPPTVAAVRDSGGDSIPRIADALDCPRAHHVPDVTGDPLADAAVRRAFDDLSRIVGDGPARSTDREGRSLPMRGRNRQ